MKDSVSVVIPHYRAAHTIERALLSVLAQTVQPVEIVIVDDASPDQDFNDLQVVVNQYSDRVLLRRLPENCGPSTARNLGWDTATGEFVAFLDADDSWVADKLAVQLKFVRDMRLDVAGTRVAIVEDGGPPYETPVNVSGRLVTRRRILWKNPFSTPGVLLRRGIPIRFNPKRRYSEDFELWLRLVTAGFRVGVIEQPLCVSHKKPFGVSGLSSNTLRMSLNGLDVLHQAFRRNELGLLEWALASTWSAIRATRRAAIMTYRYTRSSFKRCLQCKEAGVR